MKKRNIFLLAVLLLALAASGAGLLHYYELRSQRLESEEAHRQLQEYVSIPAATVSPEPTATPEPAAETDEAPSPTPTASPEPVTDDANWPEVDFEELKKLNGDVVGWIYIENTNINYPILQGDDNQYYLNRLISGEENREGSIYLDYRNEGDFSDRNNVVYGHHLAVGTMFSELFLFKEEEFFEKNDTILLMTPEKNYKVTVMAARIAELNDGSWDVFFDSDQEFLSWISYRRNNALYTRDVKVTAESRILTLSTCSYEFDDARLIIEGVINEY